LVAKERRTESRRKTHRTTIDRRAVDIRMQHEKANTQNSQVFWTCLVAISLAVASIYKVSHPLTDERFVRQSRSLASQPKAGYSESHEPASDHLVRTPNFSQKVD